MEIITNNNSLIKSVYALCTYVRQQIYRTATEKNLIFEKSFSRMF